MSEGISKKSFLINIIKKSTNFATVMLVNKNLKLESKRCWIKSKKEFLKTKLKKSADILIFQM